MECRHRGLVLNAHSRLTASASSPLCCELRGWIREAEIIDNTSLNVLELATPIFGTTSGELRSGNLAGFPCKRQQQKYLVFFSACFTSRVRALTVHSNFLSASLVNLQRENYCILLSFR